MTIIFIVVILFNMVIIVVLVIINVKVEKGQNLNENVEQKI